MTASTTPVHLPTYQTFMDTISILSLPISGSELHGIMCGYLCAGASQQGESYLQAFINNPNEGDRRTAILAMFDVYAVSQQQISNMDFEFQLLLPEDDEPLVYRAQAFSEWCGGFTQGLAMCGVHYEQLEDEEVQEAAQHIAEFAQLDYEALHIDEEDERALVEVSEYARLAVLRIYSDLHQDGSAKEESNLTH